MYYRIEETTSEDRRTIAFALDTVIEDLERAYRLMVSLYEDYAYEMPDCSQWEDVRDRSNVIIEIVHNAIFSYKLTVSGPYISHLSRYRTYQAEGYPCGSSE